MGARGGRGRDKQIIETSVWVTGFKPIKVHNLNRFPASQFLHMIVSLTNDSIWT